MTATQKILKAEDGSGQTSPTPVSESPADPSADVPIPGGLRYGRFRPGSVDMRASRPEWLGCGVGQVIGFPDTEE